MSWQSSLNKALMMVLLPCQSDSPTCEPKRSKLSDATKDVSATDGSAAAPTTKPTREKPTASRAAATDPSVTFDLILETALSSCKDSGIDLLLGGRLFDLEYADDIVLLSEDPEPRTLRRSTVRATAATDAEAERRRMTSSKNTDVRREALLAEIAQRKNVPEVRRLTQEELLAEAKVTEEINRRSLARYQRLEIEKKKARIQKTVHSTPMIRYHSFTVPAMEEQPDMYGVAMVTDRLRESSRSSHDHVTFCLGKKPMVDILRVHFSTLIS
ncbi:unnamed protein product [Echinostoma caproni]|uniref:YL1 domain-containing protein n=1 Tax=Echinostoma caproni TaxID=27848 RepID=A0A183B061_9TREM|nr:unnamed protein product [Echinostoma caproni]